MPPGTPGLAEILLRFLRDPSAPITLKATKASVMTPMKMRTIASEMCAANAQAIMTPIAAPGIMMARIPAVPVLAIDPQRERVLHDHDRDHDGARLERRHDQREQRRAACPTPAKPPLDRPSASTAGTASA